MGIAEENVKMALMNTLAQRIATRIKELREDHLQMLLEHFDETGGKSFIIRLPGSKESLGDITLNQAKGEWVVDDVALLDWAKENAAHMVKETVVPPQPEMRYYEMHPSSQKALLDSLEWDEEAEAAVDKRTGEVIPGVSWHRPERPKAFQIRPTAEGKERLLEAWASGELTEEILGGELPQIGG